MTFCTFVVPTLGRDTLQRAVDSVYAQTDEDWELYVLGDGVIPRFDRPEGRFHDIHYGAIPPGAGGSAGLTRNRAWDIYEMTCGPRTEWFAFLDDDDQVAPNYVRNLRAHAEDYPWADVVVFRMKHPRLGFLPPPTGELRLGTVGISFALKEKVFEKHKFKREDRSKAFHEDWEMISEVQKDGHRIFLSPHVNYLVRDA